MRDEILLLKAQPQWKMDDIPVDRRGQDRGFVRGRILWIYQALQVRYVGRIKTAPFSPRTFVVSRRGGWSSRRASRRSVVVGSYPDRGGRFGSDQRRTSKRFLHLSTVPA